MQDIIFLSFFFSFGRKRIHFAVGFQVGSTDILGAQVRPHAEGASHCLSLAGGGTQDLRNLYAIGKCFCSPLPGS